MNRRPFLTDQYDAEDATLSGDEAKSVTAPSPKKSKRGVKKRVVSIPIGDVERSKSKGEAYPPSDSWAWRKYGQKPIKGSPYPRGYYRCSSSKGCPARKQVERSRVDPTTVVITYAGDHNHAVPATKHHHHHQSAAASPATPSSPSAKFDIAAFSGADGFGHEFGWLADVTSTSTLLHSPIICNEEDASMVVLSGGVEEEESFFADLGELPECSMVFRRSVESHARGGRCGLSAITCLGGTG